MNYNANLKPDERAALKLRGIYEQYGYQKYRMGRFEEYSLYASNKDFLAGDKVITFTDLDGRLLALKPDVTLSIIKNTKATRESSEKLYYIENIYRESKESHTFKEISQLGLEFLGDVDLYGVVEVISLAAATLGAVSDRYILELSHMRFTLELLNSLPVSEPVKHKILKHIRNKNADGIRKTCEPAGVCEESLDRLCKIPFLYGRVDETLKEASKLIISQPMQDAIDQIHTIYRALEDCGCAQNVQTDFSIVNDIDYYNGVIFKGYIEKLARSVLAGGQYDSGMKKFGKDLDAIGFALYLNELSMLVEDNVKTDVDALILYQQNTELSDVIKAVSALKAEGLRVRAEKSIPRGLRFQKMYRIEGGKWMEVEKC